MSDDSDLLIAVCTYNEMENLPGLYSELRNQFPAASILVVDDGSPDGTGDWCDTTAGKDKNFKVIHRAGKLGLGSASIAAFRYAIEHDYSKILTMDGDWSHHPEQAPAVVERITEDSESASISIGSRYVPGGKIEGWPWTRKWMSYGINTLARWSIGLRTRDCSSAFRCYRVSLLSQLDLDSIRGMGYAYLEELLWHAKRLGAIIVEEPITFTNRIRGKSKINLKEAFHAVWILLTIGFRRMFGLNKISDQKDASSDSGQSPSS